MGQFCNPCHVFILSLAGAIPFRSIYTASLVSEEGITGVVAVNEHYELRLCSYQEEGWKELGVPELLNTS